VAEGVANALASSTSPAGDATFRVWVRSLYERVRGPGDIPFAEAVVMAVIRALNPSKNWSVEERVQVFVQLSRGMPFSDTLAALAPATARAAPEAADYMDLLVDFDGGRAEVGKGSAHVDPSDGAEAAASAAPSKSKRRAAASAVKKNAAVGYDDDDDL